MRVFPGRWLCAIEFPTIDQSSPNCRPVVPYASFTAWKVGLVERRLAAILAADVVGFSRLMGVDEAGTLAALNVHRKELLDAKIAEHKGRIVKLTGDGMLVEFPSVVNAVACAAEIQGKMRERNADVPESRRIEFRVGVNVGDVIVEGDDIFGDGVNVAARLESIATPGGVAISGAVRDHLGNRLDLAFEDIGEQALKNIERPVRVYRLAFGSSSSPGSGIAPRSAKRAQSDKPSVAVLPFTNMSGDAEQEYFADGITEDIITDLSKVSGLSVIARNSVFTYKGKHADVQEVGRRFNVSTVLEGSVRKAGNRVRINAQLIDARDGTHLWADRYDRDLADIFALQDEITKTIVEQLKVKLLPQEKKSIETVPTSSVDAYNYYLRGRHLFLLHTTPHVLLARRMYMKAVEIDPAYARAYAGLADAVFFLYLNDHEGVTVSDIFDASTKALGLDPALSEAHASHGIALHHLDRYPEAVIEFERALALDPNNFWGHYLYAYAAREAGDRDTSAKMNKRASEIAPDDCGVRFTLTQIYLELGRTEEAKEMARSGVEAAERMSAQHPELSLPLAMGAASLFQLGERTRALEWCARALAIAPNDPMTLYNAACSYALMGELDLALSVLERWRPRTNAKTKTWIRGDSDFDPLLNEPRFQEFLARLG
ncbi:tetratricopeptide repeat protein [soil metagenome]